MTIARATGCVSLCLCVFVIGGNLSRASIVLPPTNAGLSELNGDFHSYSLGLLAELFGKSFEVQSSPGQIADGIVIMTGASGGPVNDNPSGMDDAFPTPSGNGSPDFFETSSTADPSGNPSVDVAGRWDADVAAIRTFLAGGQLVFFFNLNEQNATDGQGLLYSQDELGWARLDLIDAQGILATKTFFVSAADDPSTLADELALGLAASAIGAPDPNGPGASLPGLDPQWSYIHGTITVASDGTFLHYGPFNGTEPFGAKEINQNLGANLAAFALYNKELSDLVNDPLSGYDRISIDIKLARLNNGYEQAFILPMVTVGTEVPPQVPELSSLLTWGGVTAVGGVGLVLRRHRRRR